MNPSVFAAPSRYVLSFAAVWALPDERLFIDYIAPYANDKCGQPKTSILRSKTQISDVSHRQPNGNDMTTNNHIDKIIQLTFHSTASMQINRYNIN